MARRLGLTLGEGEVLAQTRTYIDVESKASLVLPAAAWEMDYAARTWRTSVEQRNAWGATRAATASTGVALTAELAALRSFSMDEVEVANGIAPRSSCAEVDLDNIRVMEFNLERGRSVHSKQNCEL